jgi:hypothetical protein
MRDVIKEALENADKARLDLADIEDRQKKSKLYVIPILLCALTQMAYLASIFYTIWLPWPSNAKWMFLATLLFFFCGINVQSMKK